MLFGPIKFKFNWTLLPNKEWFSGKQELPDQTTVCNVRFIIVSQGCWGKSYKKRKAYKFFVYIEWGQSLLWQKRMLNCH